MQSPFFALIEPIAEGQFPFEQSYWFISYKDDAYKKNENTQIMQSFFFTLIEPIAEHEKEAKWALDERKPVTLS